MTEHTSVMPAGPMASVELIRELSPADMNDLCDATDAAIEGGGGFGWIHLPARETLEAYWNGVITVPSRLLFVARLDGVICGTAQLVLPPKNNEAQSFSVHLTTNFVAPWARKYGLARMLLEEVESWSRQNGYGVINLDVRETMTAAIALYESVGYICYGTHPCYARIDGKVIAGRYYCKIIDLALTKIES